jgi:ABC-type uncharacterized transport system involved in gliding motility auxiliary subunit
MKRVFIRFQLVFVSLILLATLSMVMALVIKNNFRWDATTEKIYSISDTTIKLLKTMESSEVEVLAFYPHDDPGRMNFDVFLRECQMHHPKFKYRFYDPDRVPSLAKKYSVKSFYTVVILYQGRHESVVAPTEESFTNALLRLANPKQFNVCFLTGHGEASTTEEGRSGITAFRETLASMNYGLHDIILLRDKVPAFCHVVVIAGPHQDFDATEFRYLKKTFKSGRGIFFMVDPMDPGAGKSFKDFMKEFGVLLGEDVIVDKMSRLVGGDFLVPLVNQYVTQHPITENFQKPTFFPVARSLQPSDQPKKGYEVVPLALSSSGSWSETNLQELEKGEAAFDPAQGDLQGPLPLVVAIERKPLDTDKVQGPTARMAVVGDSDFLTNAYVNLSGNHDFALNIIQWLTQDDRMISIHPREPEFKPLFLTSRQRTAMLLICVAGIPLLILLTGIVQMSWRKRTV